jgi:mono/diheme cytochrome c family protein
MTRAAVVISVLIVAASLHARAQQGAAAAARTVWSGVYTEAQAARGKAVYDASCSSCHGAELGGLDGPALAGDDFLRNWLEDDLNSLYTKIHRRMPGDAPGSLSERETVDVMTYLLRMNEFPAGAEELTPDEQTLSAIRVENKSGSGPVPNFSLVRVVGCLSQRADKEWMLTRATDPVRTRDTTPDAPAASTTLGSQTFQLMDVAASKPDSFTGQVVQVKGLLMRQPEGTRLNVTSLQASGATSSCP